VLKATRPFSLEHITYSAPSGLVEY